MIGHLFPGLYDPGLGFPLLDDGVDQPDFVDSASVGGVDAGDAIRARLESDPEVGRGFPGGIFRDRPPGGVAGPYLVYRVVSSRQSFVTSSAAWHDTRARIACFAATAARAVELRALALATLEGSPLPGSTPSRVADLADAEVPKTVSGRQTAPEYPYQALADFQFFERRGA